MKSLRGSNHSIALVADLIVFLYRQAPTFSPRSNKVGAMDLFEVLGTLTVSYLPAIFPYARLNGGRHAFNHWSICERMIGAPSTAGPHPTCLHLHQTLIA